MQKSFTDQLGREINISFPPQRIISLVPSQTELLFDLGLSIEIVGRTKFCIHPETQVRPVPKIGGTKNLNLDLIRSLKPDLIIANKEENEKGQIEELMAEFPVWISDIDHMEDAKDMILQIGTLVNRQPEAAYLNHLIHAGFNDLQTLALQHNINARVAYFIWKDPFMLAGKDTFIDDLLRINGMENVMSDSRYPVCSEEELKRLNPQWVFLSSEPYPFKETHIEAFRAIWPRARVRIVDGEMFSWYGSRLVKAVQYFFEFQKEFYLAAP